MRREEGSKEPLLARDPRTLNQSKHNDISLTEKDSEACTQQRDGDETSSPGRLADWATKEVSREQLLIRKDTREALDNKDIFYPEVSNTLIKTI